jgi:hypothetical protein
MKKDRQTKNAASEGTVQALVGARVALEEAQAAAQNNEAKWTDRIKQIESTFPRDVVIQAACIAWWDYFGSRAASEAWADFDKYKAAWKSDMQPDMRQVRECLVAMGYDAKQAEKRCKQGDSANASLDGRRERKV